MWEIYDELINTIPEDIIVDRFLAGLHWFLVGSLIFQKIFRLFAEKNHILLLSERIIYISEGAMLYGRKQQ